MGFSLVCKRCKDYVGQVSIKTCREDRGHDAPDWIVITYPIGSRHLLRSTDRTSGIVLVQGHGDATIHLAYVDQPGVIFEMTTRQAKALERVDTTNAPIVPSGLGPLGNTEVAPVPPPPPKMNHVQPSTVIAMEPCMSVREVARHMCYLPSRDITTFRVRGFKPTALSELLSKVQPRLASFGADDIPYFEIKKTKVGVGIHHIVHSPNLERHFNEPTILPEGVDTRAVYTECLSSTTYGLYAEPDWKEGADGIAKASFTPSTSSPSIRMGGEPGNDVFVANFPQVDTKEPIPTASVSTYLRCSDLWVDFGESTAIPGVTFPTPIIASAGAGTPVHVEDACLASANVLLAGSKIWLWGDGLLGWLQIPVLGIPPHRLTYLLVFR